MHGHKNGLKTLPPACYDSGFRMQVPVPVTIFCFCEAKPVS